MARCPANIPLKKSWSRLLAIGCCWAVTLWPLQGRVHADEIDFDRQIRPILANHCYACHGFDAHSRQADLRLDTRDGALTSGSGDAIVPGDPDASQVIQRIQHDDPGAIMPPPEFGKPLSADRKRLLQDWIQAGAVYTEHWAFQPLTSSDIAPGVDLPPSEVIDHWIAAGQQKQGLEFSPPASPETLLRRLSLDLIGLPPTLPEQDEFLDHYQTDPQAAYIATVDRLLASPHYGERWGRWWLDQARYADSNGYSVDSPRQIWLFRDWVIAALNRDQPFTEFTIEQIAGDLLPDATESQKIATGFHRNTPQNEEGGIDVEQFRIESVVDRVATTGTVWLGLTIGCAQCHDHKFDPIAQTEFYSLFAFFNQQDEPKLKVAWPNPSVPTTTTDPPPEVTTLVLQERSQRRPTHVLIKGDFTRKAAEVSPGTPSVLPPVISRGEIPDRLDLARWLVAPENPLTARVMVNRVWQVYFGRGLVESDNDFGLQGTSPSHPELLDDLASRWIQRGWSFKQLHRWIVMSRTYQQSSNFRPELREIDPDNRWLARQHRLRLEAELVRDAVLMASGSLTTTIGGPPVYPPMPDGAMSLGQVNRPWKASTGPDRFRRSLYTFTYRAVPPPILNVFDAPDGVQSCTRRLRSNTPLQALTMMNDAGLFELAQQLATRIEVEGLVAAFRRCTSRRPNDGELAVLSDLSPLDAARVLLNLDETISRE
ncbi:MAG: PSD1 and planctomycete cytochrome C domain-containing protein [Pirellulaceae bacterium]|nr:PSD1 and planctomycete cytochrome C domain-containing protein [Pirellulaceae bacterium]